MPSDAEAAFHGIRQPGKRKAVPAPLYNLHASITLGATNIMLSKRQILVFFIFCGTRMP
jgi:hypothetical protein